MISGRIKHQTLSTLCERVGISFEVGLDPHRVFDREAESRRSRYSRRMKAVADHVRKGGSLAEAVSSQGNYFPPHFSRLLEAGERTGRLDRVLARLAEYYQQLAEFRKVFSQSILWPLVQLILGVLVVGLMIYLPELLVPEESGEKTDLLGLGLVGNEGLVTYSILIACCVGVGLVLVALANRGYFMFLVDWAARLPLIGNTFRVFAEARFVQTLSMAIESGIDAWSAVDLSFQSAGTPQFKSRAEPAKEAILQGRDIHSVLGETSLFQRETLEAVELGEASGRLAETLDKQFKQLKSQVRTSMAWITYVASGVIWGGIAIMLIMIIIQVFSLHVDNLGDAATQTIKGGSL
ncbi:MAG: type II secretion system F family protein [Planctomycetota bacterium]